MKPKCYLHFSNNPRHTVATILMTCYMMGYVWHVWQPADNDVLLKICPYVIETPLETKVKSRPKERELSRSNQGIVVLVLRGFGIYEGLPVTEGILSHQRNNADQDQGKSLSPHSGLTLQEVKSTCDSKTMTAFRTHLWYRDTLTQWRQGLTGKI